LLSPDPDKSWLRNSLLILSIFALLYSFFTGKQAKAQAAPESLDGSLWCNRSPQGAYDYFLFQSNGTVTNSDSSDVPPQDVLAVLTDEQSFRGIINLATMIASELRGGVNGNGSYTLSGSSIKFSIKRTFHGSTKRGKPVNGETNNDYEGILQGSSLVLNGFNHESGKHFESQYTRIGTILVGGPRASTPGDDLINAAKNGDLPRVIALLDAGADVNARRLVAKYDVNPDTPLMCASEEGHLEVVQALLAKGANVNARTDPGSTALMFASQKGRLEVVRALLGANADVNARSQNGGTALMLASLNDHPDVVRALIDAKADVNAKMGDGITTALTIASLAHNDNIVQLLTNARGLDAVSRPKSPGISAREPADARGQDLINAASDGDLPRVEALLAARTDVNAAEGKEGTVFWKHGATALMMASLNDHGPVVLALLNAKADVNAKKEDGATALFLASAQGHLEVVQALLDAKADVNAEDNQGVTALGIAKVNRHKDVMKLLRKAGASYLGSRCCP
jgi:ankyrin repeat protein